MSASALQSFKFVSQLWTVVSGSDKKENKKGNKRRQNGDNQQTRDKEREKGDKADTMTNKKVNKRDTRHV